MRIMDRYVTGSFLVHLATVLLAVAAIYIAVDFFEKIDDFMEAEAGTAAAISYFLLKIPSVLALVAPVAVLLSALIAFGLMAKHLELVAFKSAGGRMRQLLKPVLLLGVLASLGLFLFSEFVVPLSSRAANNIWHGRVKKDLPVSGRGKDLWFKGEGLIAHIGHFALREGVAYNITINWFDPRFRLLRRMDAKKGKYQNGAWRLENVTEQIFSKGRDKVKYLDLATAEMDFSTKDLEAAVTRSDEMTSAQLLEYVERAGREGYNATPYRVDLAAKPAFPFVCLIMAVLGGGIALRSKRGEGLARNVVVGVFLAFGYWVVHSLSLSLGYAGLYPPLAAAWTANALFGTLGALMTRSLD